jgi:hypothetical protein
VRPTVRSTGDRPWNGRAHRHEATYDVPDRGRHDGGTYTMTVQAIGTDNHLSDLSAPLTVTIPAG